IVLISVDFPQPLGPRMATCSSAPMRRLKSSSAIFCPRITRRFRKYSKACLCVEFIGYVHLSVDEKPLSSRCRAAWITLNPDAAQDLSPAPSVGFDHCAAHAGRGGDVFLRAFEGAERVETNPGQDWV